MGALSALPLISAGNLCCCLWLVSGGVVAAYVLQQNQETPITPGDGALAGLLAGIVGAFVYLVLVDSDHHPDGADAARDDGARHSQCRQHASRVPRVRRDVHGWRRFGVVFGFFFMLVFGAIFSTLGGCSARRSSRSSRCTLLHTTPP